MEENKEIIRNPQTVKRNERRRRLWEKANKNPLENSSLILFSKKARKILRRIRRQKKKAEDIKKKTLNPTLSEEEKEKRREEYKGIIKALEKAQKKYSKYRKAALLEVKDKKESQELEKLKESCHQLKRKLEERNLLHLLDKTKEEIWSYFKEKYPK